VFLAREAGGMAHPAEARAAAAEEQPQEAGARGNYEVRKRENAIIEAFAQEAVAAECLEV